MKKDKQTKDLRRLMKGLANKHYFNYGGQGPLPSASLDAITKSWETIQELGPFTRQAWRYTTNEIEKTRKRLASICGVDNRRIALTENVTAGCILPLWGLPFSPGDRILISDCEHPGIKAACKELSYRHQLKIDIIKLEGLRNGVENTFETERSLITELEKKIIPRTKVVVISHVLWNTGQVIPINPIAKMLNENPYQPYLVVDGAQSFGQIPIKDIVKNTDIYAFTGHKWACGPEGLGGVSLSKRILVESRPTLIGWRSLQDERCTLNEEPTPFHLDSRRFEIATSCTPLLAGLRSSLDLLDLEGTENKRLLEIQTLSHSLWSNLKCIDNVTPILEGQPPTGLVSFSINNTKTPTEIVKELGRNNIWIRDIDDPKCLRACLHITTTAEEISALTKAIREITLC